MKRALLVLLGLFTVSVAYAAEVGLGSPPAVGELPASVPFAPRVATSAPVAPSSQSSSVATSIPPAPAVPPGGVGMPPALAQGQGGQASASAGVAPQAQLVDPSLFGTLADPSFQDMKGKMFPMTDEQIRAFHQIVENNKRITAEPARTPPRAVVSSQTVSLSPGSVPPLIRLANGYVTSVVFVDETGAPWPISAYSVGNPNAFNIQWDAESNLLLIQGQGAYVSGNMAVTLDKLPTPIMLTIVSEQTVVDYRVDFRVQGRGPNASGSIISATLPQNNNQMLMNLLDGVPPSDAKPLEVMGGMAQAWIRGDAMYVRTPLTVLSPSWTATMSSPDGTKVYQMNPTPMVLVSDRGQSVVLKVKGL